MSGASNALARQFLTDVHRLCSKVARLAGEDESEDSHVHMVALWSYLLQGRGFLLLRTLDLVIDQVHPPANAAPPSDPQGSVALHRACLQPLTSSQIVRVLLFDLY